MRFFILKNDSDKMDVVILKKKSNGQLLEKIMLNQILPHVWQAIDMKFLVQKFKTDFLAFLPHFLIVAKEKLSTITELIKNTTHLYDLSLPDNKKETKTNLKAEKRIKKFEKKKAKLMNLLKKHRLAFAGMSIGVAVLLIILLCIPLCAGVCLIISGGGAGSVVIVT